MKRREFIAAIGGAAAWPLVGHAQQPKMPVIWFLGSASLRSSVSNVNGLRVGSFSDPTAGDAD
jgi:putative tryptophan/tyrosine transport system substrate-binding protein